MSESCVLLSDLSVSGSCVLLGDLSVSGSCVLLSDDHLLIFHTRVLPFCVTATTTIDGKSFVLGLFDTAGQVRLQLSGNFSLSASLTLVLNDSTA